MAPARFALPIPTRPADTLPLSVALIRDLRCQVPAPAPADVNDDLDDPDWLPPRERWLAGLASDARRWWEPAWVATPMPAAPTQPKLIPIVSTAETRDAVALAQLYIARWPQQENIIRDFLIPLGLDTNHGYAKTAVANSESAKQRAALSQRRATLQRWADGARERETRASQRYHKRWRQVKARSDELYRALNQHQSTLVNQGVDRELCRLEVKVMQRLADAEIRDLEIKAHRALDESNTEHRKVERYCQEQRTVLRALSDLNAREQQMYELNNDKDQVMTVCKVALANLVMWTRDQYFPADYTQATWHRLAPFFRLRGRVTWERATVRVELRPFNDRYLARDLAVLCDRVNTLAPHLPDGRQLVMTAGMPPARSSDLHRRC